MPQNARRDRYRPDGEKMPLPFIFYTTISTVSDKVEELRERVDISAKYRPKPIKRLQFVSELVLTFSCLGSSAPLHSVKADSVSDVCLADV